MVSIPSPTSLGSGLPQPAFLGCAGKHGRLVVRASDGARRRSGISAGAIEHAQPKLNWIDTSRERRLVHETFERHRRERAQPAFEASLNRLGLNYLGSLSQSYSIGVTPH